MKLQRFSKVALYLGIVLLGFYASDVFAQAGSTSGDIGGLADNIRKTFAQIAQLVTAVSYVAGMGFAMASILKFKAHRDNPTQIPIGTPIALLFVAAALLFLPALFGVAGKTVFGTSAQVGSISGVTSFS